MARSRRAAARDVLVTGSAAGTLTKADLADAIAAKVGVATPKKSGGSTILSELYSTLLEHFECDFPPRSNAYSRFEQLLNFLGTRSHPVDRSAGGTITEHGLRKLLSALTTQPRCFVLNENDHEVSAEYGDARGKSYGFDKDVTSWKSLVSGGPRSRVIFYRTGKATAEPKKAFYATAVVSAIEPAGDKFRAVLTEFHVLERPIFAEEARIKKWNRQHSIVELQPSTFDQLVELGRTPRAAPEPAHPDDNDAATQDVPAEAPMPSVVVTTGTVRGDEPPSGTSREGVVLPEPSIAVPEPSSRAETPASRRARRDSGLDQLAEITGVERARAYLESRGYLFVADRQKPGEGHDFEYKHPDGRPLYVEIKGIRSSRLEFNMTWREFDLARESPSFVVLAVTDVLSDERHYVHWLDQMRLSEAEFKITALRVKWPLG